jgi:hypothetical protein
LHERYEKLLPPKQMSPFHEPSPFYKEYLTVHQYLKAQKPINNEKNNNTNDSLQNQIIEKIELNVDYLANQSNIYPIRKSIRPNAWKGRLINEAKFNDPNLNHVYLINKLLVSYGAQNMRNFYTTINGNFKCYLKRLNCKIPQRIVPLIWNDPVIQKLAKIISNIYSSAKVINKKKTSITPANSPTSLNQNIFNFFPKITNVNSENTKTKPKKNDSELYPKYKHKLPILTNSLDGFNSLAHVNKSKKKAELKRANFNRYLSQSEDLHKKVLFSIGPNKLKNKDNIDRVLTPIKNKTVKDKYYHRLMVSI